MEIGAKIKALRQKNGLTIEELANRCELTKGFISQIERDLSSLSIDTLNNILEVLGTNISDFFKKETKSKYVYTYEDRYEELKENYKIEWLVPNASVNQMEPVRLELSPGCESQHVLPFEGEIFGYVLKGTVTVVSGAEQYIARENDSFYLYGDREHYLKNNTHRSVEIIWISTPPIF